MSINEEFIEKFHKMLNKRRALNRFTIAEFATDYRMPEMRCMELIAFLSNPNVTRLSEEMLMTKGGISKIIKKLKLEKVVESYMSLDNKKEIYFRLTNKGEGILDKYKEFRRQEKIREAEVFSKLNDEEKTSVINFLNIITDSLEKEIAGFDKKRM